MSQSICGLESAEAFLSNHAVMVAISAQGTIVGQDRCVV
jgi:hypothetical protein